MQTPYINYNATYIAAYVTERETISNTAPFEQYESIILATKSVLYPAKRAASDRAINDNSTAYLPSLSHEKEDGNSENYTDASNGVSPTPMPLFPDKDDSDIITLPLDGSRVPPTPTSDSATLDELLAYALNVDFVSGARILCSDGKVLIAALTKPFYLKSERDLARKALEEALDQMWQDGDVVLTFDVDIFRKMDGVTDSIEIEALYQLALSRV